MNKLMIFSALLAGAIFGSLAQTVSSPDGGLEVNVSCQDGKPLYSVSLDGEAFILDSPLGLDTSLGDFASGMALQSVGDAEEVSYAYSLPNIKQSRVDKRAIRRTFAFGKDGKPAWEVTFEVGDNDVAYRYRLLQQADTLCALINSEATGFVFPPDARAYLSPYSLPMDGWKRTYPSYEMLYELDAPMGQNGVGAGYVFPSLFRIGDKGWALISETGVDGSYCASHLKSTGADRYAIAFPQPEEMNGRGDSRPAMPLPGYTPWRTITVGQTLAPIVETTVPFDVVEPKYSASKPYDYGKGTWSWIIRQDESCNYAEQKEYIDFAADMGYETVLVDALWDENIGTEGIEELARYGKSKGVDLYLWYNSNGSWNDAPQGPRGRMDRSHVRRQEMEWMQRNGIRGIKVDFFGGDKQEMMWLYEDILSDANDYGLLVIFHGCTLPRGWERMYPNYASSEAVLASENLNFRQDMCDTEALNATIHPFSRNAVASMDFGGSALNKYYNAANEPGGSQRRTSDVFALATAVLFQSPVQHFALAPNNLTDAPSWAIDFMKDVPTTWDEVKYLSGEPGKYAVIARRSGDAWYVAGINAGPDAVIAELQMPMLAKGNAVAYTDDKNLKGAIKDIKIGDNKVVKINIPADGAFLLVQKL